MKYTKTIVVDMPLAEKIKVKLQLIFCMKCIKKTGKENDQRL